MEQFVEFYSFKNFRDNMVIKKTKDSIHLFHIKCSTLKEGLWEEERCKKCHQNLYPILQKRKKRDVHDSGKNKITKISNELSDLMQIQDNLKLQFEKLKKDFDDLNEKHQKVTKEHKTLEELTEFELVKQCARAN